MLGVEAESDDSSEEVKNVEEDDGDIWRDYFAEEEIGDVTDLEAELGVNADDLSSESETDEVFERNPKRRRKESAQAKTQDPDDPKVDEVIEDID